MSKMDALVKKYPEKGLWLERVDIPRPNEGEALVKIKRTAICGTDAHIYNWDEWSQKTIPVPMIIGHEFVGEIAEINGASSMFKIGDVVSAEGHVTCGLCRNCREDKRHLCKNTSGIGVNRTGIFAEYAAIPLANLWKCDPSLPLDMYSIFDPFGNATHTALMYNVIGEDVLVTGAGPIGIMAAAICCFCGARHVFITDIKDYRLELAKQVCPSLVTVNTMKQDLNGIMKERGVNEGFGVGLEMSGSGIAFDQLIANMMNGGNIAVLAMHKKGMAVDWDKVVFGMLTIKGIYGRRIFETWHKMTAMLQGGLDISKIITHRMGYKDFLTGFELMTQGICGKVVLNWEE